MIATYSELNEYLEYNHETGVITWKKKPSNRVNVGAEAKKLETNGYVRIGFRRVLYQAHRVAYLLYHGEWPEGDIDHINGNREDNRIANLRVVTTRENGWNRVEHREDGLIPCVLFDKRRKVNPWRTQVHANGRHINVGQFPIKEEAIAARDRALAELKES